MTYIILYVHAFFFRACIRMHTPIRVGICIYPYICTLVHAYACVYIHINVCTCVHVCLWIHVCIYIHCVIFMRHCHCQRVHCVIYIIQSMHYLMLCTHIIVLCTNKYYIYSDIPGSRWWYIQLSSSAPHISNSVQRSKVVHTTVSMHENGAGRGFAANIVFLTQEGDSV